MALADTGLFPEELVFNIFLKTRLLQLGAPAAGEAELLPTAAFRRLRGNSAPLALPCPALLWPALPCFVLLCPALSCLALSCLALPSLGEVWEVAVVLLSEGTWSIQRLLQGFLIIFLLTTCKTPLSFGRNKAPIR